MLASGRLDQYGAAARLGPRLHVNPDDVLVQGQRPDQRSVDAAPVCRTPSRGIERFGRTIRAHHFHGAPETSDALGCELLREVVEPGATARRTLQCRIAIQLESPLAHPLAGALVHPSQSHHSRRAPGITAQYGPGKSGRQELDRGSRDHGLIWIDTPEQVALLIGYRDAPGTGRGTRSLAIPASKLKLKALCDLLAVGRHNKRPGAK